jgi:hypothetical protein
LRNEVRLTIRHFAVSKELHETLAKRLRQPLFVSVEIFGDDPLPSNAVKKNIRFMIDRADGARGLPRVRL